MGKRSSKYCRTSGRGQGTTAGKKFCRNPHYCRKLNSKYCKSSGRGRYSSYCKINRKKASTQAKKCKWLRRVCVALSWRCRILRCRRRGRRSMKTIRRQAAANRRMKKKNPTPPLTQNENNPQTSKDNPQTGSGCQTHEKKKFDASADAERADPSVALKPDFIGSADRRVPDA